VGLSEADHPWFQQVKTTRDVAISQLIVSKLNKTPVVVVAVPLGEAGGPFRGAMSAGISVLWLAGLSEASSMPAESVAFLIDRAGRVVTRAGALIEPRSLAAANAGNTELDGLPGKDVLQSSLLHDVREFAAKGSDGIARLYSLTNLSHSDIFFILGVPEAGSFGFARRDFVSRMLAAMAMVFCALVGVAVGGDLLVARGLRALSAVAQAYRHGDYSARPDVKGGSLEVLQLSETLSRMAERVQRHEQDMSRAIQQKDAMLKEVHHRVKNNLQVVTSLMSIQANRLKDESSKRALAELQRRVRALGLLHRHLYEGDDLRYLDFGQFTAELCQMVKESSGLIARGISIEVDIPPIPITADRAVPLGLLITEALGNALKHAFPAGRPGTIRISLSASAEGIATISISDDGIGPPPAFADTTTISPLGPGTGLLLMQAFAQQLGGELTVEGPPGTTVGFSFDLTESGPESRPQVAQNGTGSGAQH
jgi:two-component sensor histidine kinase